LKPKETDFEPKTLGEHIKRRRLELGLTQKELGKRLGATAVTVLHWEKGQRQPPIQTIPHIVSFLGYDPFAKPTSVSEELAAMRRAMGWTIKYAARQLGVDESTWGRWEKTGIPWERHRVIVTAFIQSATAWDRTNKYGQPGGRRVIGLAPASGQEMNGAQFGSVSANDRIRPAPGGTAPRKLPPSC
jgi:transcriptional regulator with XRE-family HTH domain